jgi:toxin ParE1/3/4
VKRTPVLLTATADQDVEEQAMYIATSQDPVTAAQFLYAVHQTIELLARYPRMGRTVEVSGRMVAGMRILRIKGFTKHLLCYQITKRGVEVLRVVHGAREYERLFED